MYPYLNTDVDRSTKQDACWNNKWKPLEGLRRGMIVTFWFVVFHTDSSFYGPKLIFVL